MLCGKTTLKLAGGIAIKRVLSFQCERRSVTCSKEFYNFLSVENYPKWDSLSLGLIFKFLLWIKTPMLIRDVHGTWLDIHLDISWKGPKIIRGFQRGKL